jgi:hypothetical protein
VPWSRKYCRRRRAAEKTGVLRIERVVEIEHPGVDIGRVEAGAINRGGGHGRNLASALVRRNPFVVNGVSEILRFSRFSAKI